MKDGMIAVVMIALYLITAGVAFSLGRSFGGTNKPKQPTAPKPTEDEVRARERLKKEIDNLMTYDGTPQPPLEDYQHADITGRKGR